MNEQIEKLADRADEYADQTVHYYMGQFDGLTWEGKTKQTRDKKFAELIVRECIRIDIENRDAAPGVEIAKYFGVKL
jgi:hypothetical protein